MIDTTRARSRLSRVAALSLAAALLLGFSADTRAQSSVAAAAAAAAPLPARVSAAMDVVAPPVLDADQSTPAASASVPIGDINPLRIIAGAAEAIRLDNTRLDNTRLATGGEPTDSGVPARGLSAPINVLIVLTVITLAPSIMLMMTCFVRIIIVLGLLKQALGTQTLPPPQVLTGLAVFMTLLVMAPTFDRIHQEAVVPYQAGQVQDYDELWARAKQPMRDFMFDQIDATGNWSSVYMILNYRGVDTSRPQDLTTNDVDMVTLVPAFILSELKTGFMIGFKVYLPFLVIDMVISAILLSMGMMMLPPVLISLPFKLLLFVLVDGWQLVVGSLMQSFVTRGSSGSTAAMLHAPWLSEQMRALGVWVT